MDIAVGDVSGDGAADVLIGAPYLDNYRGTAYVLTGPTTGSFDPTACATIWDADDATDYNGYLGWNVGTVGDWSGDGVDEVVIGGIYISYFDGFTTHYGAGKTWVACLAIDAKRRSTLVVAPTLDLVRQWYDVLRTTFGVPVGVIGGGEYDVRSLTVSTYDSAYLHMEHLGNRFGLVVFDECHHLPGPAYALAARACVAPFRLGLTATPERADGRHADLDELVGPIVYRKDIVDLSGGYLAPYDTVRLTVELGPDDRRAHDEARAVYRDFLARNGIRMSSPSGWSDFIIRSARSDDGRRAMSAYRRQRDIAFAAPAKLDYVELLLDRHRDDRALLFTQDNATAYEISRRFLVPIITHETRVRERSEIIAGLADGGYGAIVTSKVLNEGVDIPDAAIAIVVSGSASVREHVQRLGRVLRAREGKRALLYELVTAQTTETFTSARRRDHSAYR
jgi:superfamily II DNA or RNA helicase